MDRDRERERGTKMALTGLFLALFAAFARREQGEVKPLDLQPMDLALLGLATFRVSRLASFEPIMDPLREPLTEKEPDAYGVSEQVVPEGKGAQRALGQLVSCPICTGTWIGAALVYALRVAPKPTRLFLATQATTGVAQLVHSANEALSWTASARRKASAPEGT